jgi:hypothetical protein
VRISLEKQWWLNRAYGALAEVDGLGQQGHVPIIRHLEQVQNHHCCRVKNRIRFQIILEMLDLDLYGSATLDMIRRLKMF